MTEEVWKTVPSAPWFLVSSFGRVMVAEHEVKLPNGGVRKYGGKPHYGVWNKTDRRFITVHKKKTYRIAPLVCEAFNGAKPFPSAVCMHGDEDSRNNRPWNLSWGTQKENLNAPGYIASKRQRAFELVCQECSARFEPKYPTQKYCSRPCSYANNAEHSAARVTKLSSAMEQV